MAGDLTAAQLRTELVGKGIAIDTTMYPDATSALKVVSEFNQAVLRAQISQNAIADTGDDVSLVAYQAGAQTTITREGVTHTVRPATYQYTVYEKISVADVLPVLV